MKEATTIEPPNNLEELLSQMREQFPSLSTQFQSGARYLLDHPQEIPLLSMRKIAADAGVQPATLVRLAQHLGFEGWQALRQLFVDSVRGGPQPYAKRARKVVQGSSASRMLAEMLDTQHRNLDVTRDTNSAAMSKAVELLSTAANVHVAGFRSCFPIAFTLHYVYRLFRPTVHLIRGDAGTLEMELRALTGKDTVVVTSFAPYSAEIVRVADAARDAGCSVVALTDSTVAPIALRADCTLLFSNDSPSFFPSIAAGVALAEALVEQLLAKKGKGAIKALEHTEGQLNQTGAYVQNGRR
ncbi:MULTISPECIES: MurR/RpiR family transcriptional regulator [Cupriavidus]|uniref:MurR/RpiR family transcriptional regulator n=1 Tax=Cupriavidus pauculus TaxID=82633 RepID=A0A3G8H9X2_9BURK|nr:MurR/RpiR family transcriptional regulator [Cupriavidus pauculus]AZG17264.1 MurR/RpiR family transcriptional regulator [Cupriavidus pauculus]